MIGAACAPPVPIQDRLGGLPPGMNSAEMLGTRRGWCALLWCVFVGDFSNINGKATSSPVYSVASMLGAECICSSAKSSRSGICAGVVTARTENSRQKASNRADSHLSIPGACCFMSGVPVMYFDKRINILRNNNILVEVTLQSYGDAFGIVLRSGIMCTHRVTSPSLKACITILTGCSAANKPSGTPVHK